MPSLLLYIAVFLTHAVFTLQPCNACMLPTPAFSNGSTLGLSGRSYPSLSSIPENAVHLKNAVHECLAPRSSTQLFCVYSFNSFADGRGLSVVTTPERIKAMQALPAFTKVTNKVANKKTPSYEVTKIPDRGYGLIAKKGLHRGDRIFANTPVIIIDAEAQSLGDDGWNELQNIAVNKLPPKTRKLFWGLHGQRGSDADPASDRIDTNSFEIEIGNMTCYAVFPETSRLNHDCRPNASYFFDQRTLVHYVHAITAIPPHAEISITYINPYLPRQERLLQLSRSWGFNCTCNLCEMHPALVRASDARLTQIEALSTHLEDSQAATSQMTQTLISLYQQERLHGSLSFAYQLAALALCKDRDRWGAVQYALLAVEFGLLNDGFENQNVERMKSLAEEPENLPCWTNR